MARRRFQKAELAKQRAILDAAAAEFAAHGYEGASLNRIILAAGLSKGGFYYYFDDKADLAATVLMEHTAAIIDGVGGFDLTIKNGDFWGALEKMVRRGVEHLKKFPRATELFSRLSVSTMRDPHVVAHLQPLMREATEAWTSVWRRGQALGAVRTDLPVELQLAVIAGLKQTLGMVLMRPEVPITDELLDRLAELQLDLIKRIAVPKKPRKRP